MFAQGEVSPDSSSIEGKVLALENAWGQGEKVSDSKALHDLLDDSVIYIRYDGSLWDKTQYLASLKDTGTRVDQAISKNMTAHEFNDTVLVTGIYRIKGVEKAKPYSLRERFIDTWVRRGDAWICVATQVTLMPSR